MPSATSEETACVPEGTSCISDRQCCGGENGVCINAVCTNINNPHPTFGGFEIESFESGGRRLLNNGKNSPKNSIKPVISIRIDGTNFRDGIHFKLIYAEKECENGGRSPFTDAIPGMKINCFTNIFRYTLGCVYRNLRKESYIN